VAVVAEGGREGAWGGPCASDALGRAGGAPGSCGRAVVGPRADGQGDASGGSWGPRPGHALGDGCRGIERGRAWECPERVAGGSRRSVTPTVALRGPLSAG